jgi:prepilin peptidase CpaA
MALLLHLAALAGFAGLMLVAAIEDFRRFIIPNALTLALCVLWPFYLVGTFSLLGTLAALGCAALVFVVGALCFSRGYLGGGDVKLLTAATLWAGPGQTPALLAITGLFGGLLALFLLTPFGAYAAQAGRALLGHTAAAAATDPSGQVPYGVAIAGAALLVTISPHFG